MHYGGARFICHKLMARPLIDALRYLSAASSESGIYSVISAQPRGALDHQASGRKSRNKDQVQSPCRNWMQGHCRFGIQCKYRHDDNDKGSFQTNQSELGNEGRSKALLPPPSKQPNGSRRSRNSGPSSIRGSAATTRRRTEEEKSEREKAEREEKLRQEALEARKAEETAEKLRQENLQRQQAQRAEVARLRKEAKEAQKAAKKRRQEELVALRERQAALRAEEEQRKREAQEAAKKRHQEELAARREQEAVAVEKFVASGSSLIECGAGLEIRHVITGFDLCRITIKNLPRDAKQDEIADIFRHQGIDSSQFFISQVKPNGHKQEAVVLANADQGQAVAIGLEGIEFRDAVLNFAVDENAHWSAMGSSSRSSPFLTISWWVPSETLVVTYSTMEEAQTQAHRLNSKIRNGRRLRAVMNNRPTSTAALRYYRPESVKVMGCPTGTEHDDEIYDFLGSHNVKVLKSAPYDHDVALRTVRQLIANHDGAQMETYEVLNDGTQLDGEVKIKVQFHDWEEAKAAHNILDKRRLGLHSAPVLRSWLPKPLQYTINIPRQQYEAQKKQWDSLSEKKKDVDAHVHARIGDRGVVFIRVLGKDKKAAGSLKVRVESMVAGDKLDSTTHWHPSFASPKSKTFFDRIYTEIKVYVRNDFKTRSLKIYGEADVMGVARQMIQEEVDRLAQMETKRILDPPALRFFMREGLGKLKELLGEENVVLNVAATPATITIKGGGEANHHFQRLFSESKAENFDGLLPGSDSETCPICTDDASHPEQLGCGHTYCSACLKHFLTSATEFPLVCMGDENTCKVPVALPFIRRFLPKEVFEHHIEAAFALYLEKHPKELKYCTTPDCTQIYRRNSEKKVLQCPSCFSTICSACDEEAHEGMTCEERRIHQNPAEQERLNDDLAAANGWKKCPQCTTFIEKTEGCNHMTCKCGAHVCWVCMGIFDAGTIYTHMGDAHGGIYDEVPDDDDEGEDHDIFYPAHFNAMRAQRVFDPAQGVHAQAALLRPRPYHNANVDDRDAGANNPFVWADAARIRVREAIEDDRRRRILQEQAEDEHAVWEIERRHREETQRRQREEIQTWQREEAERRRREEAERRQREEAERRQREEAERRQREVTRRQTDAIRREREETARAEWRRRMEEEVLQAALVERRRRENREGGWGCVLM